jgi:hypothetical protein
MSSLVEGVLGHGLGLGYLLPYHGPQWLVVCATAAEKRHTRARTARDLEAVMVRSLASLLGQGDLRGRGTGGQRHTTYTVSADVKHMRGCAADIMMCLMGRSKAVTADQQGTVTLRWLRSAAAHCKKICTNILPMKHHCRDVQCVGRWACWCRAQLRSLPTADTQQRARMLLESTQHYCSTFIPSS